MTTPKYWTNLYPVQAASKVMTFHCIYITSSPTFHREWETVHSGEGRWKWTITNTVCPYFPVRNNHAKSILLPKMGVARFSTRETVEGRPATTQTIPSKKVEWGATARMGASWLLACLPLTTTRKPMLKK